MATVIRQLEPSDTEGFIELLMHRDGLDRAGAEARTAVVEWIAFQNPIEDGKPRYYVVEDKGRIVGHLGRMPTVFFVQGKRHLATFAHDLFIHPDLQKAGKAFFVAMKLYQTIERDCRSFAAMVWTNDINIRLQKTRKYDQLWAQRYVHLLRPEGKLGPLESIPVAQAVARPLGLAALTAVDTALMLGLRANRRVIELDRFDERFDHLADRIGPRMGIAAVKDQAYLNWKYTDRPGIDVAILATVDRFGGLTGFAVLRKGGPGEVGTILELCADPDDTRTIHTLLAETLRYYRAESDAPSVEVVQTDPRFVRALAQHLFLQRGKDYPLFFANGQKYDDPAYLQVLEHWHYSYGDSEGPY